MTVEQILADLNNFPSISGLTGLNNIGNTCYMDSALQCLSNTLPLTDIFLSRRFLSDINKNNPLGCKGKMA
ncbi:MAG: hypothetical protein EZS28_051749, partial [Streblomastix strix]